MPRFRKKPVEVEAVLWDGREETIADVFALIDDGDGNPQWPAELVKDCEYVGGPGFGYIPAFGALYIPTLEGDMEASPGDWIIRGIAGELYPCKPEIFEQTYEPILEQQGRLNDEGVFDVPMRLPACVEAWPECEDGGYDPRCCRFPKSCSCNG